MTNEAIEDLKKQRDDIDKAIAALENLDGIKIQEDPGEISIDFKVDSFNELYQMAVEHYNAMKNYERSKDIEHYMFEAVMEWLVPEGVESGEFWAHYNSFPGCK